MTYRQAQRYHHTHKIKFPHENYPFRRSSRVEVIWQRQSYQASRALAKCQLHQYSEMNEIGTEAQLCNRPPDFQREDSCEERPVPTMRRWNHRPI